MKKVSLIVAVFVTGFSLIGLAPTVGAQQAQCNSIVITNTGAGSVNNGVCTVYVKAIVTCVNNVYVLDTNSQTAATGAASVLGSTNGGSAISGNATNTNGASVAINSSCGSTSTSTTPTTPSTPSGNGSTTTPTATPSTGTATTKQNIAVLPNTAANQTMLIATVVAVAAAALFATSRIVLFAYRRVSDK